jgi:hypothetical protein
VLDLGLVTSHGGDDLGLVTSHRGDDLGLATSHDGDDVGLATSHGGDDFGLATSDGGDDLRMVPDLDLCRIKLGREQKEFRDSSGFAATSEVMRVTPPASNSPT